MRYEYKILVGIC